MLGRSAGPAYGSGQNAASGTLILIILPAGDHRRLRYWCTPRPKSHYPLVIQTHGYDGKSFFADGRYTTGSGGRALAANGIVVLQMDELNDYMNTPQEGPFQKDGFESAIRSLSKNGLIDPKRVGVIGFSYTEFYVLYALTHRPNLFAAASVTDGNDKSYQQYTTDVDIGGTDNPF
jgi:dipeptidyl aminopeptidase/acylaminoacyl peptidase